MRFLAALLLAGCAGCSAAAEEPEQARGVTLSPEPALAEVTELWAGRWTEATGIPVLVGTGGAPVTVQDEIPDEEDGHLICGRTETLRDPVTLDFIDAKAMQIDLTPPEKCPGWENTLGHEMMHALGARGHATDASSIAAGNPAKGPHVVDASAVDWACAQLGC